MDNIFVYLIDILLAVVAAVGWTVILLWPSGGVSEWLRKNILDRIHPQLATCYVCCSVWVSLVAVSLMFLLSRHFWAFLLVPGLTSAFFWLSVPGPGKACSRCKEKKHGDTISKIVN